MEILYGDIGRRLKYLALALFLICSAVFVCQGCVILLLPHTSFDEQVWFGLALIIVGPILSFISTWVLYGFGQLIENTDVLIQCNISSGKSLMHISRVAAQKQKSKEEPINTSFIDSSDDRSFVAFVEKSAPEELHKFAATFDDSNSSLSNWKKEYVLSKLQNNKM